MLQALNALKQHQVDSLDLCRACLKRAEKLSELNAFITVTEDYAIQQAENVSNTTIKGLKFALQLSWINGDKDLVKCL